MAFAVPASAADEAPTPPDSPAKTIAPITVDAVSPSDNSQTGGYVATKARTGTKTDADLKEVPQSISVITEDQMQAQNAQSLNQALGYTAGVVPGTRGSAATRYDLMTVRGLSTGSNNQYLDGLHLSGGVFAFPQMDMWALSRVEVMKGPSSVLYGQGSPAGIVNMVSKHPADTPFGVIETQTGNNHFYQGAFDIGGPVPGSDGTFLYRLTGLANRSDNQINLTENKRLMIAPAVTWRPTDTTSLTILSSYQHDPKNGSFGSIPSIGTVLYNPVGKISRNFYDGDPNYEKFDRTQAFAGYEFEHKFNDIFTFRQNARYQHTTTDYNSVYSVNLQADNITLNRLATFSDERVNGGVIDNQIEAKFATGPVEHTVLVGLDYIRTDSENQTGNGLAPTLNIFNPVYYQIIPPVLTSVDTYQRQTQTGLYAQDQIRFDKWVLLAGLRQDWAYQATSNRISAAMSKQSDNKMTGRAGLVYLFDNGLSPYISYSTSFMPTTGVDYYGKAYKPTTGKQIEGGVKYQPAGFNSFATLAVYDLKQQNVQTADPLHPFYSVQTGEIETRGVEIEAHMSLAEGFDLVGAYTHLDTETTRDNSGYAGNVPVGIPSNLASLWGDYTLQDGPAEGLGAGLGVRYVGASYGNPENTFKSGSYTLLDAAIHYDLGVLSSSLEGIRASINASNLLDKDYVASCYSNNWCWYGAGRTLTGTLSYRW
ncbi:MAG: TonB-dependent siderophore receptor [Parvibaculaceae bacterium]|nr:TonB-dependent siderophore receptor [Parvibaculaceae bacterium]